MGLRGLFGIGLLVMLCGGVLLLISADAVSSAAAYEFTAWNVTKWISVAVVIGGAAISVGAAIRLYVLENRPRK
jgi:hypothetical protein